MKEKEKRRVGTTREKTKEVEKMRIELQRYG